jgi:hypothetical protein
MQDLIIIAFFYLLRSGVYTARYTGSHPFTLSDVGLWHGARKLDLNTANDLELLSATRSYLTFTTQKNGVRNEKIGHATTSHPIINPTTALATRIVHLRRHNASPGTPIAHYFHGVRELSITTDQISPHT